MPFPRRGRANRGLSGIIPLPTGCGHSARRMGFGLRQKGHRRRALIGISHFRGWVRGCLAPLIDSELRACPLPKGIVSFLASRVSAERCAPLPAVGRRSPIPGCLNREYVTGGQLRASCCNDPRFRTFTYKGKIAFTHDQ